MVAPRGQMARQVAPVRAVGPFPGARQTEHIPPAVALNGAQIRLAGQARIGDDDDVPAPSGRLKSAQNVAQLDVLLPSSLRIEHDRADRDAPPSPVRQHQQPRVAEDERLMLIQPGVMR